MSFRLFIMIPLGCIFPFNFWLLHLFDVLPCIVSGMDVVGDTGKVMITQLNGSDL